jgi:cytidyltransferase-like protein
MKVVLVTGGFDPLHSGHIEYFTKAKELGDILLVGVNSDEWLTNKKGRPFMPIWERMEVISNIKPVGHCFTFDDTDGTAIDAIHYAKKMFPTGQIIFANGGDRTAENIPEMSVEEVTFEFGVGGENKKNSSSWILEEWKSPKTERPWGFYRVMPGQSLSMQKHQSRNEYWIVSEGKCLVNSKLDNGYSLPTKILEKHKDHHILVGEWHQLFNTFAEPCRIVEIQYGDKCIEEDIERL